MKKLGIIISDGVGLRNFAFTDFCKIGQAENFDITFWNNTPFDLKAFAYNEIRVLNAKTNFLVEIYKNALIRLELTQNIRRSGDSIYDSYRFPYGGKGLKSLVKNTITKIVYGTHNSDRGIQNLRKKIKENIKTTDFFKSTLQQLQRENPDMLFFTNQRITLSLAYVLAAQELGIPTATFIFSWDNLPKGTKILETDHYFVWSEHMKKELLHYYPETRDDQVFVTGTPQFEPHFDRSLLTSKEIFFAQNNLDVTKKYICFSGDDITTSPYDPQYLSDTADAVKKLNAKGYNLGIIFRRCPVDFSNRYDSVLEMHNDLIVNLDPLWEKAGAEWNAVLPTKKDLQLQINTIFHSEMVINLGSTMVFDFVTHNKPCGYINYDIENTNLSQWSVGKIYKFIHFRSMPEKDAVFWLNSPLEIADKIEKMLTDSSSVIENAHAWFQKINQHPVEESSQRIWDAINKITKK